MHVLRDTDYPTFGCLESAEWNDGMNYWNGILEWTGTRFFACIYIYSVHEKEGYRLVLSLVQLMYLPPIEQGLCGIKVSPM